MSTFSLKAELRSDFGKEKAKKLRRTGRFPAIIYGADKEPAPLSLDIRDVELVLQRIHGEKVLVDLQYGDRKEKVFVRNVQRDPVIGKLLHVDFYRVDLNREIDTKIPIISKGLPLGVKEGGLLEMGIRELQIRCLPTKVPPHLDVDVEPLHIGQSIHVRDLAPMDGVRVLSSEDAVLFSVVSRQKEEEPITAEPSAEEAAATEEAAEETTASKA